MPKKITQESVLRKALEAFQSDTSLTMEGAIATVVGPFKPGNETQHGVYSRACLAVYEGAMPRKMGEDWFKWIGRMPKAKQRAKWRDGFRAAIRQAKKEDK